MGKLLIGVVCILFFFIFILFPAIPLSAQQSSEELPATLNSLKNAIDYSLKKIDRHLIAASQKISVSGLEGAETERVLLDLCLSVPGSIDCATVDRGGRMVSVMPQEYKKHKGADISDQEQLKRLIKTEKPVLSTLFRSIEGIQAVDIEYPVFSKDEKLTGSVSLLLRSAPFLAPIIDAIEEGFRDKVWVIQRDGKVLYGKDEKQIGLMMFEDPLFDSCKSILSAEPQKGGSSCELPVSGPEGIVKGHIFWDTVMFYGTEWRLLVVDIADRTTEKRFMPGSDRDSHGCIGSAGYSWCETKEKCLRIWEEPCP